MSGEEVAPPVKNWFLRSVSFGGVHGSTTAMSMAAASKGLSEGKHAPPDRTDAWGGLNVNLRQLSMRRVKTSSENERDSPSMVPRNVTPLTPLTPLRWKSNARDEEEEEEKKERGEETKLVHEPKAMEHRSRLGLSVTHAENPLPTTEDVERIDTNPQLTSFEDAASESPSGQDTKAGTGEDVMTMTIDFLRARLLSERSASKAAKQQIQELGMKVTNLELKLNDEVEKRTKAEKSTEEALLKLLTGNFSRVADCTAKSLQHVNSGSGFSAGEEIKEELLESSVGGFSRTDSIGSSLGSKDSVGSQKKDNRATIEKRIQKTWSQMSADMNALAEEGRQSEQLMHWMEKAPALLQNVTTPQNSAFPEMQSTSVNGGQQKKKKAHESESRENAPPSSYRERDAHGLAPTIRSAEEAFRHDHGGAHPMQDDRDGLDQTSTGSHYRQIERHEPRRSYRRDHRRSRSADRSNWPAEEDYRLRDMSHPNMVREETFPPRRTSSGFHSSDGNRESSNGITRHHSLNAKTNSSVQYMPPAKEPVPALEPKLLLGYGPTFDAPRDHASSPPYQQGRASYNSITDVLLALRKAKASIQNSSSDRAHVMHPQRASWEAPKSTYGVDSQNKYYNENMEHDMEAARIRPSNSSPSLNYNTRPAVRQWN